MMIQAAKLASAKRITAVVPLYPYARLGSEGQAARADLRTSRRRHAAARGRGSRADDGSPPDKIQGFFTIPVDHMTALPLFARHFRDVGLTGDGVVSVSPDAGRAKLAVRFAEMIEANFAIMHKTRPAHDRVEVAELRAACAPTSWPSSATT